MLNMRTLILSVVVVVILMLAVPLVTARTEAVSYPAGASVIVLDDQDRYNKMNKAPVLVLDYQDRYDEMNKVPISSYRSPLDVCYDVSIRELAACRDASQALIQADQSPVDECFDVSISELAGCRKQSQESIP
jgi:hypothetical protein